MIDVHPVPIRVGTTIHLAAQAVNRATGARGPLLTAEGCNLDDTQRDIAHDYSGGSKCRNCHLPVTDEDIEVETGEATE